MDENKENKGNEEKASNARAMINKLFDKKVAIPVLIFLMIPQAPFIGPMMPGFIKMIGLLVFVGWVISGLKFGYVLFKLKYNSVWEWLAEVYEKKTSKGKK